MGATMKYIGGGSWFPGVPARDLSEAETAQHADFLATETGRKLYETNVNVEKVRTRQVAVTPLAPTGKEEE